MGEPFEGVRISTVGANKMVLEVRQTKTQTLDLKHAGSSTLLERLVRAAAVGKHGKDCSIHDLVDNNASRSEVSWLAMEFPREIA
jgi:hypothetical protein